MVHKKKIEGKGKKIFFGTQLPQLALQVGISVRER